MSKNKSNDYVIPSDVMNRISDYSRSLQYELKNDNPHIDFDKIIKNLGNENDNKIEKDNFVNFILSELQKDSKGFKNKIENILSNLPQKIKSKPAILQIFTDDKGNVYLEKFINAIYNQYKLNPQYIKNNADLIFDDVDYSGWFGNRIYKDKKSGYIMKMQSNGYTYVYNPYKLSTKGKTIIPIVDDFYQSNLLTKDGYILILDNKKNDGEIKGHIIGKGFTDEIIIKGLNYELSDIRSISYYKDSQKRKLDISIYFNSKIIINAELQKNISGIREINIPNPKENEYSDDKSYKPLESVENEQDKMSLSQKLNPEIVKKGFGNMILEKINKLGDKINQTTGW